MKQFPQVKLVYCIHYRKINLLIRYDLFTISASELKSLCQKRNDIAISMGQQRHGDALDEKFCIRLGALYIRCL